MSEAEGALLLGSLAKMKQQVPVLQPLCPWCSAEQGTHNQPTLMQEATWRLSDLCCALGNKSLCSSERAEEGAHCVMECAELCLVRGTLFGGVWLGLD